MNGSGCTMGSWQTDCRDEGLALFHDMQRHERRKFLYPLADDVYASPSSTPTRTGQELLPIDSEKNDFDWLLTPPATPLFPLLDQDHGPIVNLSQRRVLTRSTAVSKSARLSYPQEPSPKIIHGGDPSRKHPSTASSSTSVTDSSRRGRSLSCSFTSRSSPTMRSSSPSRPIAPTRRSPVAESRSSLKSLTPTVCRNNTSPSAANRAGLIGGRSRGKPLTSKLVPLEPSFQGAEPPQNLCTSLSDSMNQRGMSHVSKSNTIVRGSFAAEMLDASSQHVDSPDGFSLYCLNDQYSSQNSRASEVSYDDVDMADFVLSGSTISDNVLKSANAISSKIEHCSLRRSALPVKRQMRSAKATGDTTTLSFAARKSYERQAHRNAQAMFRPLLSSAPITLSHTSRHGGLHLRSSGPFVKCSAAQLRALKDEGLHGETATEVAAANPESGQSGLEVAFRGIQETVFSQDGSQSVLSDGSFRKRSPIKVSHTHLQDGSLFGNEKNGRCDSFLSDSHSLIRTLASAPGGGQSVDRENSGGAVVGKLYSESTALVDKSHSAESVSSSLDRDSWKKGASLSVISSGMVADAFEIDVNSEASPTGASNSGALNQDWLPSVATDLMAIVVGASTSEVYLENPLACVSTSDGSAQQDVLSVIGRCASRITMLDGDVVQHGFTEAAYTGQSRRFLDGSTDPWLAKATDTIVFCSSIVHELVYKAATLATENEEQKVLKPLVAKRDFVALLGLSGAENRRNRVKTMKPEKNHKCQPLANRTMCEISSSVQRQRMVHRQTPALTMQQSPMERIENAVMGNHEEMHTRKMSILSKRRIKQVKTAKCRCSCCVM